MKNQLKRRGRVLARRFAAQPKSKLARRVAVLEQEMQEQRRLNRRLAELTDLVEELLVPATSRDEEKLRALLEADAAQHRRRT